jgi:galactose mutarotase-like enzyme
MIFSAILLTIKETVLNLTSHPYFNLNGSGNENILNKKYEYS